MYWPGGHATGLPPRPRRGGVHRAAADLGRVRDRARQCDVWSLLAVAVLGGAGLAVRIRAEERQLTQALGAEYERFAAGRKRLVPGVW